MYNIHSDSSIISYVIKIGTTTKSILKLLIHSSHICLAIFLLINFVDVTILSMKQYFVLPNERI